MKILAIETSCDETAAAVVEDGTKLISFALASSGELHEKTGGIIPETAARKQVESMTPVLKKTLSKADLTLEQIDKIAVTVGPGLIGSLVVGVAAAKALGVAANKPVIPVNHLIGHIYASWVDTKETPSLPAVVLIVSGGHTDLVLMKDHGKFEYLGGTLDDAAGEAFDKTARLLGLKKYLGGSQLSKLSRSCKTNLMEGKLPRPKIKDEDLDFSFSGLKTAVRRIVEEKNFDLPSLANEFETAAVDVLVSKTMKAVEKTGVKTLLLGGGVSANKSLRQRFKVETKKRGITLHVPKLLLCTDSAIYIASAAFFNQKEKDIKEIEAIPSLGIVDNI